MRATRIWGCSVPREAGELLEGAQRAGYHLLVADLGSLLEDGHRELIDQADLVLGVVRPTLESLPDVFRLATVLRAQGMGRKLAIVASGADDDAEIRRLAREADVAAARAGPARIRSSRSPPTAASPPGRWHPTCGATSRASRGRRGRCSADGRPDARRAGARCCASSARRSRRPEAADDAPSVRQALARVPLSAATLGTVRRMLVARSRARGSSTRSAGHPSRRRRLRRTIGEILAEPELDLDASPALVAAVEAAVCGLGPLQPLVDDPLIGDILVNGPGEIFVERVGPPRARRPSRSGPPARSSRSPSGSPPSPGASCRSPTRWSMPGCPTDRG